MKKIILSQNLESVTIPKSYKKFTNLLDKYFFYSEKYLLRWIWSTIFQLIILVVMEYFILKIFSYDENFSKINELIKYEKYIDKSENNINIRIIPRIDTKTILDKVKDLLDNNFHQRSVPYNQYTTKIKEDYSLGMKEGSFMDPSQLKTIATLPSILNSLLYLKLFKIFIFILSCIYIIWTFIKTMKQDKIHWISYIFIPIILFNFYLYVQPFNLLENELNVFILFNFILIILLSVTYFILKNFNKKYLIKKQKDNENNENEESSILKNNDNNENEESSILKNNDNNTNKIKNKDLNKIKENNEK